MKVAATQATEAAVATQAKQATGTDGAAFKAALDGADIKLRKGEEIEPVAGRRYAEITKGAREGMYLNTSGNARHGEAFVLVRRNGKEFHVYGSGKDRLVVGLHKPKDGDLDLRKGERTASVEGRKRYEEIVSGEREGMFVNTSGNARDGKAFVRVIEDGVEYHIYGAGEDRLTIANDLRDDDKPGIRLRKGERVERVEGRGGYVEIVSGPREGMFINTSGNARHGEAFVRSIKDGVERHIYGSGDDRVVVSSGG
ncbi:MAG TPA: hypothetical protein VHJ39_13810 [Solirubrobacteraceae bacterium]|nr:hypothetical protein [Solirubrobacteraceae bacterium]